MTPEARKKLNTIRDTVVGPAFARAAMKAIPTAPTTPEDARPRYSARHPLAGQLREPLARFREQWGTDEEIHGLLLDPLIPPEVKAVCAKANGWYLETHALRERDEAAAESRLDELRTIATASGLDPERFAASQSYRAANRDRVEAVLQRVPVEEQRDQLDAQLDLPLPEVVEPEP